MSGRGDQTHVECAGAFGNDGPQLHKLRSRLGDRGADAGSDLHLALQELMHHLWAESVMAAGHELFRRPGSKAAGLSINQKGAARRIRTRLCWDSDAVPYAVPRPRHSSRAAVRVSLK